MHILHIMQLTYNNMHYIILTFIDSNSVQIHRSADESDLRDGLDVRLSRTNQ